MCYCMDLISKLVTINLQAKHLITGVSWQEFARTCDAVFKRSERRTDLERWHTRLLTAMLEAIPKVAQDHGRSPQEVIKMGE